MLIFQSLNLAWEKISSKGILILSPDLPSLFKKSHVPAEVAFIRGFFFHPLHYPLQLEWVMVEVMQWVVEWVINEKWSG